MEEKKTIDSMHAELKDSLAPVFKEFQVVKPYVLRGQRLEVSLFSYSEPDLEKACVRVEEALVDFAVKYHLVVRSFTNCGDGSGFNKSYYLRPRRPEGR